MESELFFWFVAVPALLGIPYLYIMYVAVDVYQKGLLPPRGYRRELAIYYFKIIFVVLFFWMPYLLFFVALRGIVHPWTVWAAGSLAHTQTLASAYLACQKQDVRAAFLHFWCCIQPQDDAGQQKASKRKGRIAASVCHGNFPVQRSDYGFDGETEEASVPPAVSEAPNMSVVEMPSIAEELNEADKANDELAEFNSHELRTRLEDRLGRGHQ